MERFWKVLSLSLIVGIVAVLGVGLVFAQDGTPEPPLDGEGRGPWHWDHDRDGRMGFPGVDREDVKARLADVLGITLEEFDAAIADGDTLASLAEANGVSLEEIRQAMDEIFDDALAQAVTEGKITQEQADQMLEGMERKGERCGGKFGSFGGHRFRGGGMLGEHEGRGFPGGSFRKGEGLGVFGPLGGV